MHSDRTRAIGRAVLPAVVVGLVVAMAVGSELRGSTGPVVTPAAEFPPTYAVPAVGAMRGEVRPAGLLVVADRRLADRVRSRVSGHGDVVDTEPVGLGSVALTGRSLTAVAVDPATYRRFSALRTARSDAVWHAVARGELVVTPGVAGGLRLPLGGAVPLGPPGAGSQVRLGAIATTVPGIDVVVNRRRGAQVSLPRGNALVVSLAEGADPAAVRRELGRTLGQRHTVTALQAGPTEQEYAARLVGGSVADAVGAFRYRWFADGSVQPDPAWVSASIATGEVPLLGRVTCHRVLFPQLRGALQEVVDAGLASAIDPGDYGGCYVPRFIDREPSRGLSLHTWGIAVDLNVAGNQLGTSGLIDRRVVEIFTRWGFAWGGTWRRPDPMHFELAVLRRP